MPYLTKEDKERLGMLPFPQNGGELNYMITKIIKDYMGKLSLEPKLNYQAINDVVGALECAKMEYYRRKAVPYEAKKIDENGDVY